MGWNGTQEGGRGREEGRGVKVRKGGKGWEWREMEGGRKMSKGTEGRERVGMARNGGREEDE